MTVEVTFGVVVVGVVVVGMVEIVGGRVRIVISSGVEALIVGYMQINFQFKQKH